MARGDWFLFIDADSYPRPALVADLLEVIDSGNQIGETPAKLLAFEQRTKSAPKGF